MEFLKPPEDVLSKAEPWIASENGTLHYLANAQDIAALFKRFAELGITEAMHNSQAEYLSGDIELFHKMGQPCGESGTIRTYVVAYGPDAKTLMWAVCHPVQLDS